MPTAVMKQVYFNKRSTFTVSFIVFKGTLKKKKPVESISTGVKILTFLRAWIADVHFWNYQGREVLVYSLIDEAKSYHHNQRETCMKRS